MTIFWRHGNRCRLFLLHCGCLTLFHLFINESAEKTKTLFSYFTYIISIFYLLAGIKAITTKQPSRLRNVTLSANGCFFTVLTSFGWDFLLTC